jgi:hypothetical protein
MFLVSLVLTMIPVAASADTFSASIELQVNETAAVGGEVYVAARGSGLGNATGEANLYVDGVRVGYPDQHVPGSWMEFRWMPEALGVHELQVRYEGDNTIGTVSSPLALVEVGPGYSGVDFGRVGPPRTYPQTPFWTSLYLHPLAVNRTASLLVDGVFVKTVDIDDSGHSRVQLPGMAEGTHVLTAQYAGDELFRATAYQQVITTSKALGIRFGGDFNCPPTPGDTRPYSECMPNVTVGRPSPVKVSIGYGYWVAPGEMVTPAPTGAVDFYERDVHVGTATIVDGLATLMYTAPDVGVHSLTFTYGGDAVYQPSPNSGTTSVWARAADAPSGATGESRIPVGGEEYRIIDQQGGVWASKPGALSTGLAGVSLNAPIVGAATTASRNGYWLVASDGGIFAFGDAVFHGSMGGKPLNKPIVGMAATPSGNGYWLVASDGGIFAFGDATFFGSMGGKPLNKPVVGMTATASGNGYWFVASDGGVFAFGDATFFGSMGGKALNKPIVAMTATTSGKGYWFVANDGGVFAYGDAGYFGSMGGQRLNQPIVSMVPGVYANGYVLVAQDGGIFTFGDTPFQGTVPANRPPAVTVIR